MCIRDRAYMLFTPLGYLLANQLIERTAIYQLILELAAGRIGGFYQDKQTLIFLFAYLDERLYAVTAQVRVYSGEILVEGNVTFAAHLYLAQMTYRIGCGGGADVAALNVADDYQIPGLTIIDGLLVCLQDVYKRQGVILSQSLQL